MQYRLDQQDFWGQTSQEPLDDSLTVSNLMTASITQEMIKDWWRFYKVDN